MKKTGSVEERDAILNYDLQDLSLDIQCSHAPQGTVLYFHPKSIIEYSK